MRPPRLLSLCLAALAACGLGGAHAGRAPVVLIPGPHAAPPACDCRCAVTTEIQGQLPPCLDRRRGKLVGERCMPPQPHAQRRGCSRPPAKAAVARGVERRQTSRAGLAGSVLEERLNRTSAPAFYCSRETDWRVAWLSLSSASRPECLLDELAIFFNATDGRYYNQSGVEIRPYQFGNVSGVAALDPGLPSLTGTFHPLVAALQEAGHREGRDLFGAPYDFRLAADGLEQVGFFVALAALVERAVGGNGGARAVLVAHSMGSLVAAYFLARQVPEWRRQHVGALLAVSAPWEGAVTALKGSVSGDNFDVPVIPHDLLHPLQATLPSGPWLFPAPDVWGDEVLVSTAGGDNYTASDALQLLRDLNHTQQAAVYPRVHAATWPLPRLGALPVHCLHGRGVATEMGFEYDVPRFDGGDVPAPARTRSGDGDGTVNLRSLQACRRLGDAVQLHSFANASHLGVLRDARAVRALVRLVRQHGPPPSLLGRLRGAWAGLCAALGRPSAPAAW